MVSWNNLDTLSSYKELADVKPACLTEVMSGDNGAERVKNYPIRTTCLSGGAGTLWISGSGSTLMAVTDDTIVAKFLQVRLREQFPTCETHILTCDTEGAQIEYL